jgi:hypothetical protein
VGAVVGAFVGAFFHVSPYCAKMESKPAEKQKPRISLGKTRLFSALEW